MKTIMLFLLTASIALAGDTDTNVTGNTANGPAPIIEPILLNVKAAEACIEKMQSLIEELATMHASLTNQAPRDGCVLQRLSKAKAVYELVKDSPAEIRELSGDDAEEVASLRLHRVALGLTRIEMLLQEAKDCLNLPLPPSKQPRQKLVITDPALLPPTRLVSPTESIPLPVIKNPRPYVARKSGNAIKQGEFAKLLVHVAGMGARDTGAAAIEALNQRGIAPPEGWREEQAVNLDDFSVVMTQILRINIEPDAEPSFRYQALLEQGIPVAQCFPSYSSKGEAPLLLEVEVQRCFAIGLAEGITHPGHPD